MRTAALALGLALGILPAITVALAGPGQADAGPAHITFASPAQATGGLRVDGLQWVLLVFHAPGPASFVVRLDGPVVATNDTVLQERQDPGATAGLGAEKSLPRSTSTHGAVAGSLGFAAHAWSSLYVEAEGIALDTRGFAALERTDGDRAPADLLPRGYVPRDATSPAPPPAGLPAGSAATVRSAAFGAPVDVVLHARGVRHVLWHNATAALDCGAGACPDQGAPWATTVGTMRVQRLSYIHLQVAGGELDGGGQAIVLAAGGARPDVAVVGDLRLRDAAVTGTCADRPCPDPAGQTLRATGALALGGLAPGRGGRLQADLSGTAEGVAFDETPVAGFRLGPAVAAAAGAAGLALFAKGLLSLFARSARPPVLQHPRRRQAFDLIRAEPGLSFRDLHRRLAWPNGPLQKHLQRLVDAGVVAALPYRNTVRYFENHGRYRETWRPVAQLRDPRARHLHGWLADNPGASQAAVVAQATDWGWSRSATQRLLRSLRDAGLVAAREAGRALEYEAVPGPAESRGRGS